jgi:hypothetical protein
MVVRQHNDGRCIVYGIYTTNYQGEAGRRGGIMTTFENVPSATEGYVTSDAIKAARALKQNGHVSVTIEKGKNTVGNGATFPAPDHQFPDVDRIIPKFDAPGTVRLNARFLHEIMQAIGGGIEEVTLTLNGVVEDAIGINMNCNAFAVLMPVRA